MSRNVHKVDDWRSVQKRGNDELRDEANKPSFWMQLVLIATALVVAGMLIYALFTSWNS